VTKASSLTSPDVLEETRRIARDVLAPSADETDRSRKFPRHAIDTLGKSQLLGLLVPRDFGGYAAGLQEMADVLEILAQGCASTAMVVLMHYCSTAVIAAKGSARLREAILPQMVAGKHLSTLAFSEPGSGGHFYSPTSRAIQRNGSVELNALKSFATSAGEADSYLISTLNARAQGPQELDIYFVPRDMPGLEPAGLFEGLGLAGNASAPLSLKSVVVSAENRLGAEQSGLEVLLQVVLPHFQIGSAAVSVGIAGSAFERAVTHVTSRKYQHANQSALAQIPRVQYLVAEMAMELRSIRAYLHDTIRKAVAGEADAMLDVLAVKAKASEACLAVVSRAMTLGGGSAFGRRGGLERIFRDAQAAAVMAPASDVLKDFIGKAALGLPLF
jgi:isovaleryl-CoA dehydrogenase